MYRKSEQKVSLYFTCDFLVKLLGLNDCHFGQFGQLTRDIFRATNA